MAFDADAFRKAAEAAGISKAEIENEIKFQSGAPSKTDPFEKDSGGFKLGSLEQIQERLGNDWWHLPAGLAAIGAGIYGASQLLGGDKAASTPLDAPRIDPTMDAGVSAPQAAPQAPQQPAPAAPDLNQRAAQIIEDNRQRGLGTPPPQAPAPQVVPAAPVAPPAPIATPLSSAPVDAPAPLPSAKPGSAATEIVADTIKELIAEPQPVAPPGELRTGTGKLAYAGQGPEAEISAKTGKPKLKPEYASLADVPSGYALVPEGQYIDALRQDLGQAAYTKAFTGQNFPSTYEQAQAMGKDINRELGRPTREAAKAAGLPPAEITPGITKMTSSGKKGVSVKGLGLAGALVALSDLAKAETAGQRGIAGANLLEAILPPGFTMSGAGEGSGGVPSVDAAMLLGSPYAQTEIAKKRRQQEEYTRKVGAGRGIAPPSSYMR
jgi:hypothetical protein